MDSLVTLYMHLMANYKFQTACYVIYIYDHFLTLPDEVDKIWSQRFNFATLLFYINRYVTHGQFIILQVEFYETTWSISMCNRYVKFAGAATMSLVAIAELIMILRVYALYLGNKRVLLFLLSVLSGQVIVMAWAIHFGIRVPQPPGFPGCVLTGSSTWFAGLWGAPLVTDSCIFILTLWRTIRYRKGYGRMTAIQIILRDGTIYFFVIFSANLMNCLLYFLAVEDLKAVGASFSQILTAIMISRLQLNLRDLRRGQQASLEMQQNLQTQWPHSPRSPGSSKAHVSRREDTTTFFTIGNLGENLQGTFFEIRDDSNRSLELEENSFELQNPVRILVIT